jgi:hypothetical protein
MEEIRETGIRGFLKWLQQAQPAIYAKAAPQITQKVPNAFSDYHAGGWRVAGLTHTQAVAKLNGVHGVHGLRSEAWSFGPRSQAASYSQFGLLRSEVDAFGRRAQAGSYSQFGDVPTFSMAFDPNSVSAPTPVDVSTAANDGSTSSSLTDMIGGIVKGISSLYMTKQQADIQQQVVNTQLQRAAAGLPPLPTSLANLGVPQVSVGLSTGTGSALAIGGALIAAVLVLPKLFSKRR